MDDLKPCPFCGKKPILDKGYGTYALLHSCAAIKTNIGRGKKEDLQKIWNARPIEQQLQARIEEQQQQLNWFLSRCTVDRWGISLPCGQTKISELDKQKSLKRVTHLIKQE